MSTMQCVVDASVLVAATRPSEKFHAGAQVCLQTLMTAGAVILVPTIALAELAAAISRGGADADLAEEIVDAYRRGPNIELIPVDKALGDIAAIIAAHQRIRGCDAVYVALAQDRAAVLITLDNEQRQRSPSNVSAWTPEELLKNWHSG